MGRTERSTVRESGQRDVKGDVDRDKARGGRLSAQQFQSSVGTRRTVTISASVTRVTRKAILWLDM